MIHIFKLGGAWKSPCGTGYSCKAIRENEKAIFLNDGWHLSLDEAKNNKSKKDKKPANTKATNKEK